MKLLADYYRETTAENFGKRGMSVIGHSVVINKTAEVSEAFKPTVGPSSATGTSPTGRELPTQQTFFDHVMHDTWSP